MEELTTIEGGTFSLDEATRTARGLLIPYNEPTDPRHRYPATFRPGTITVPGDYRVLRANRDHDLTDPVAVFSKVEDTEVGIVVEFDIARTPEGDELIEQHKRGEKTHLSGEFRKLVKRGSEVVSGILTGAAFLDAGAFKSAALFSLDPIEETDPEVSPEPTETTPADAPAEPQEEDMSDQDIATVPGTLRPAAVIEKNEEVFQIMPERDDLFALMQRVKEFDDPAAKRELQKIDANVFALNNVTISGSNQLGTAAVQPGWIGQVWEGNAAERIIVPLLTQGILTKLSWGGWKWNVKPAMASWTGNKNAVPTNSPTATPVTFSAQRFAGGHDLGREFYDFNETEAIEAYAAAMVESYSTLSDDYTLEQLVAAATDVEAETYPTDVPEVLGKIVQGALAVINSGKANPTFAVVSQALFAEYIYTMRDNTLEFLNTSATLNAGTIAGMTIVPDPYGDLTDDQVLVGARAAATVRELPGSPVRVSALDLVLGGVDNAFFGYIGVQVDRPSAIVLVSDPTP